MATTKREKPFAIVGQGTIFDGAAYWATLAGVYLMGRRCCEDLITSG